MRLSNISIIGCLALLAMPLSGCPDRTLRCGDFFVPDESGERCTCPPGYDELTDGTCQPVDGGAADAGADGGTTRDAGADGGMCVLGTSDHCSSCGDVCAWSECQSGACNDAVAVSVASNHACIIREREGIVCWGSNDSGQLGDGTLVDSENLAVSVETDETFIAAVTGGTIVGTSYSCGLSMTGIVRCWGSDLQGVLGNGRGTMDSSTPVVVQLLDRASQISSGDFSVCARLRDGSVYCWGSGAVTGASVANEPRQMLAANVEEVSVGDSHACARLTDGTVQCWGANFDGQLGNGSTDDSATPVNLPLTGVARLAAGRNTSCAIVGARREVWCWGQGFGSDPANTGFASAELLAANSGTVCATREASVYCWGATVGGSSGESYDGSTQISGISSSILDMSISSRRACVATQSGDVYCWGRLAGADAMTAVRVPVELPR